MNYTAVAKKRGIYTLGPLKITVSDPLGFFRFNCKHEKTSKLTIFPQPLSIRNAYFQPVGAFGEHQFEGFASKGTGTDFHGVREYQIGDELRRVHWPSTARHRHLTVLEFEHSKAKDTVIAIDLKRGTEVGKGLYTSLEYAVKIAAGIAEESLLLGSSTRLVCAGLKGPATIAGRGLDQLHVILHALAAVRSDQDESLGEVILREIELSPYSTEVICLTSVLDESLVECGALLLARGMRMRVALIDITGETRSLAASQQMLSEAMSLTIIDCWPERFEGHVRHEYAS